MINKQGKQLEEPILIEIYSNEPNIFNKMRKHIGYLNFILSAQTDSGLYIEEMANGFLYIYKDLHTFKKMNDPNNPYILENPKIQMDNDNGENSSDNLDSFFLEDEINKKNFPKSGVIIEYVLKSETGDEDVLKLFENFINYNTNKDYTIQRVGKTRLKVIFYSYSSFLEYCKNVEQLFAVPL